MAGARLPILVAVAVLSLGALSGCIQNNKDYYGFNADAQYQNPGVFVGNYRFTGGSSAVLVGGALAAGKPEVTHLVSTLSAYPDPANLNPSDGQVLISLAVWRPMNTTEPLPIIVDAGPYFEIGQHCKVPNQRPCAPANIVDDTIDYAGQTTPFSLRNYLPRGYAVAQLAVRGTGTSGGCMDLMGPNEVHDLDQAITWLATQPWSNGNVAMIGASYDGSTPWEVAAAGNPHLKTIIPVSGLPDIYGLMFHNGTPETRAVRLRRQLPAAGAADSRTAGSPSGPASGAVAAEARHRTSQRPRHRAGQPELDLPQGRRRLRRRASLRGLRLPSRPSRCVLGGARPPPAGA